MNLNIEMDGEEDQRIQYVNRPSISIPSGGAAYFNLNIVNPGLTNQSYILNPVSPVGQNIVAYQSPVTLQSYIALQAEGGGNIVNNLPVGVPVPVGLPVPAGLLQNHNLVNTSIIIGNEECNSPVIIKSGATDGSERGDIKFSYLPKPLLEEFDSSNTVESHTLRLNEAPVINTDGLLKKPCPLEMSIKAANIDLEFDEKCDTEMTIPIQNGLPESQIILRTQESISQTEPAQGYGQLHNGIQSADFQNEHLLHDSELMRKPRTEITWESNEVIDKTQIEDFQESLICEVEEANDDLNDDDYDDEDEEEDDEEDEDYEDEDEDEDETSSLKKESDLSSSEENYAPTYKVSKGDINKNSTLVKGSKKAKTSKRKKNESDDEEVSSGKRQKRPQRSRKPRDLTDYTIQWSDSDEDVLDLKRIKNEFNYNCYYEPKSMKTSVPAPAKLESDPKKFVKVRNCCSKKECYKKITIKDQKVAHRNFYDLESRAKQDTYLINCIEHVQSSRIAVIDETKEPAADLPPPDVEEPCLEKMDEDIPIKAEENIQLEIENESNGNQMLSDEIQNAINESLKDCLANQQKEVEVKQEVKEEVVEEKPTVENVEVVVKKADEEKPKENNWNYYIVIDRCRKKVCSQFLIKLFRIAKNRIRMLQKKIVSGSPITDENVLPKTSEKFAKLWETAKMHLDTMPSEECLECRAIPRHRFFVNDVTRQNLYDGFKEFYQNEIGKELCIKYATYRRFLLRETKVSFTPKKRGVCAECELLEEQRKRERIKQEKNAALQNRIKKLDRSIQSKKKGRKKWETSTDSEDYSDNEPLSKRKNIKLTISLKGANKGKNSGKSSKKNSKKSQAEKKNKKKSNSNERSKTAPGKGRDVWSLMLLHLETMPYKVCRSCVSRKKHRFFDSSMTTQALYDDYRKYFLKETNSELGLGFTMYEKYFERNCGYTISDVSVDSPICPRCALEPPKPESNSKGKKGQKNNTVKVAKRMANVIEAVATDCRS